MSRRVDHPLPRLARRQLSRSAGEPQRSRRRSAPGRLLDSADALRAAAVGVFEADTTKIQLRTQTDKVEPLILLATFNLGWLTGFKVAKGEHDAVYSYADDATFLLGGHSVLIRTVQLHMHEWGSRGLVSSLRANGTRECLLQIDRWKHDYLADYELKEPARLDRGDRLLVECHFDNSLTHQPKVNGSFAEPKDLRWNEEEEMCAAFYGASAIP